MKLPCVIIYISLCIGFCSILSASTLQIINQQSQIAGIHHYIFTNNIIYGGIILTFIIIAMICWWLYRLSKDISRTIYSLFTMGAMILSMILFCQYLSVNNSLQQTLYFVQDCNKIDIVFYNGNTVCIIGEDYANIKHNAVIDADVYYNLNKRNLLVINSDTAILGLTGN